MLAPPALIVTLGCDQTPPSARRRKACRSAASNSPTCASHATTSACDRYSSSSSATFSVMASPPQRSTNLSQPPSPHASDPCPNYFCIQIEIQCCLLGNRILKSHGKRALLKGI